MSQTPPTLPQTTKRTPSKKTPLAFGGAKPSSSLRQKADQISTQLAQLYGSPEIPLNHSSTFQLLVSVMLSAQTTDKKVVEPARNAPALIVTAVAHWTLQVNEVTPELFALAPDAAAMAKLQVEDIQAIIKPIGLAPTKAKNVLATSKLLLERHGGEVPGSLPELEDLPGVGHKTASVVISQAFAQEAFPVDTHIHRLAARWGLSSGVSVQQTEADLKALYPPHTWRDLHLQIILFGREHCPAKQHQPSTCLICSWASAGEAEVPAAASSKTAQAAAKPKKRKVQQEIEAAAETAVGAAAEAAVGAAAAAGGSGGSVGHSRSRRRKAAQ